VRAHRPAAGRSVLRADPGLRRGDRRLDRRRVRPHRLSLRPLHADRDGRSLRCGLQRHRPGRAVHPAHQLGLIHAFLHPPAYAWSGVDPEEATSAIVRGTTRTVGNEIDEFVTEALRNNLLGLPLDLPAINITRARDTGIPTLQAARRDFYEKTGDSFLKPYI